MNNQKILLIDYDPASISRTSAPLTQAGYEVEVAKDGLSGLAAFERSRPALVIVEAMLPRKHGFEVCQEIKTRLGGKSTPVLITTAVCRGRKYRMDALQIYGCDEYIEKPIADQELVSMIGRFIDQAAQAHGQVHADLSTAIDEVKTDTPEPIESMSDDELEAKIDLLMNGVEADQTPSVEEAPVEPIVEQTFDADAEMERRVEAMVQVDTKAIDPPAPPVEIARTRVVDPLIDPINPDPEIDAPVAHPAPAFGPKKTAPAKSKGGLKLTLYAVAAIIVLTIGGFLAFRQGLFGGGSSSESDADGVNVASVATQHDPAPAPVPVFEPMVEALPDAPVTEPIEPQPQPAVEATPRPVLPPKPQYRGPSAAQIEAARQREEQAALALQAVAGSMQAQLLSEQPGGDSVMVENTVAAVELDDEIQLGTTVRPRARRGELFDIKDVDRVPVPVKFEQPAYDELAQRMRQEGVILIDVLVDETGQVAETRLVQKIEKSRLNDAAARAAERWAYQPAIKDGVPVMVWKRERIVFKLE